ncbi:unnamed protein product, partial [Nesidiocoris tenuis]
MVRNLPLRLPGRTSDEPRPRCRPQVRLDRWSGPSGCLAPASQSAVPPEEAGAVRSFSAFDPHRDDDIFARCAQP